MLGEGLDGAVEQQVALRERDDLEERAAARDRAHACLVRRKGTAFSALGAAPAVDGVRFSVDNRS